VDEIGKRSTMAAKAKFVRENKRLSEVLDGLQISRDAMQLVRRYETENMRREYKKKLEDLDLLENRNV
jgi:hypothetical protein